MTSFYFITTRTYIEYVLDYYNKISILYKWIIYTLFMVLMNIY